MKKLALFFAALSVGIMAFAQTGLDGTWYYEEKETQSPDVENGSGNLDMVMGMTYRFSGDTFSVSMRAKVTMDVTAQAKDGETVNAVFLVQVDGSNSGSLVQEGSILTLTPTKGLKPKVNVTTDVKGVPGGGLLKSMIVGPLKKEVTSGLKEIQRYEVVSVSEKELVLKEILTDKEIKKGEKAELATFKRK